MQLGCSETREVVWCVLAMVTRWRAHDELSLPVSYVIFPFPSFFPRFFSCSVCCAVLCCVVCAPCLLHYSGGSQPISLKCLVPVLPCPRVPKWRYLVVVELSGSFFFFCPYHLAAGPKEAVT